MLKSRSIIFRGHSSIRSIRRPYGTSNVAKNWKLILGYTVFTTTFTGAALVVTAVGEYELVRRQRGFMNNPMNSYRRKMWLGPPGQEEFKLRERMGDWFRSLVPTQTAFLVIIAVNIGILLAWKRAVYNRELSNKMFKWFTLRNSSKPITLLTSTFSHSSALHLFINMYCLWTFLPTMDSSYGLIRTLAIFFTGCVCSSYVNVLYKLIRGSTIPSVGASGGILAVVTAMAEIFPDIRLTFIIPVVAFDASTGVIGITALSVCGIIFKKILPSIDHVAHLAGIAYGYVWHRYIHTFYVTHSKNSQKQMETVQRKKILSL